METKLINKVIQALHKLIKVNNNVDQHIIHEINQTIKYLEKPDEQHPFGWTLREIIKLTDKNGSIDKLAKNKKIMGKSNKQELNGLRKKIYDTAFHILTTPSAEELKMENKLKAVTNILKRNVSLKNYDQIMEYIDHDEWGLALEIICAVIWNGKIKITKNTYSIIEELGLKMKMKKNIWEEIESLVKLQ